MKTNLEILVGRYRELGIDQQIDYDRLYLYSLITHSTAIEGSTITELENQIMFDSGVSLSGKNIMEMNMNLDLKVAYEQMLTYARSHAPVTVDRLLALSALTMKNTGADYHTALGDFSSARGELRLLNVTAGIGGRSYMAFNKVPQRLRELCDDINEWRQQAAKMSVQDLYEMSFDAHFRLVTIHPWADGNGRMARLLMNWLQFEFGLIPSRIFSEDKEQYIKALVATRENEDMSIFRKYMTDSMERHLERDIAAFLDSVGEPVTPKKVKTRDRIIRLLACNPKLTAREMAREIGITQKGIERHLAKLKKDGVIERSGPDHGGEWIVR